MAQTPSSMAVCGSSKKGDSHILSDERAQQIINKALQSGSLKQRNVTLTGLSGSGKTSFLSRLFHTQPPEHYTSTGIVGQSFRGLLHQISNISLGTWEILSHRDILEFLAPLFLGGTMEANVAALATDLLTMDASNVTTSAQVSLPSTLSSSSTSHSKLQSPPKEEKFTEKATIKEGIEEMELINVIDTGGHPEYIEFTPSIINDAHLAVLLVNLMYGLDEHPPIHVKGVSYKQKMLSQYTAEQIIKKLVVTLQAKRSSHMKVNLFRILVVATHRDCVVSDLDARVEALNQQLWNLWLLSCEEELICYSSDQIPFVLNLKDPDVQDEKTLELIRSKVSGSNLGTVIEMPGSFLKYEQHLLKYAAKVERGSLSLGECLLVGKELKMKDEEVKAALVFFHHHHTFLYFREVLPNLIFVKPQVALDFVNAIVLFSYEVDTGGFPAKFSSYLKEGIITEGMLSHDELSTCFIQGLYEPSHAIELLCHIFMLAPLDHEKGIPKTSRNSPQPNARTSLTKEKKYLMMCLLPAIPDHEPHSHVPSSPKMTPLVVKFTGGCVPLGCFSSTISCLLSTYEWRVSRNEDDSPECLACNIASLFCLTDAFLLKVVLVDSSDYIEVYVDADEDVLNVLPEVRQTILGAIGKVLDTMHLSEVDALPAVLCPCKKVYQFHPASLIEVNSEKFLYCPKAKLKVGTPHEKHAMWFGDNPLQNASPEYILQAALKGGFIPHRDDKFLIYGPGGVGKSSLVEMFLGKRRNLVRKSTALATEPLNLMPIRDVSSLRLNGTFESINYEHLSHMLAHACYNHYLAVREGVIGESTSDDKLVGPDSQSSPSQAINFKRVALSSGLFSLLRSMLGWQQMDPQEDEDGAEPSLSDESELCLEDDVLPYLATTLEDDLQNIQGMISNFLQDLQEKIQAVKERNEYFISHSIRILDSGGQPQFHELISIFLSHISGFISVFKLNEKLSDHGEVVLYDEGQSINDPYESYYSHEQIIRHNLQAIQAEASQRDMKERPNLAFVGTFLDLAHECSETPGMKDEQLHTIISEVLALEMQECVITHGNTLKRVTFQINAQTPEKQDFDRVDILKEALLTNSRAQSRDLPLNWYGLDVALHVLMEKLNRQLLRQKECELIANNLNLDRVSLNAALEYLHQLNVIAYYPTVLPHVIFGSSQVILDKITELVHYSLVLKGKGALSGAERKFVQQGIVSLQFLSSPALAKHYIPELFQPEDLLKILISQLVICPVGAKEFIMPCVLEMSNTYPSPPIPKCSVRSSFILHFSKKSPMFGVYCCTISSLISDAGWKLLIEDGEVVQVARNSFTFRVPMGLPGKLTFCDPFSYYLEVILEHSATVEDEHRVTLYRKVCNDFFKAITKAMETLHYDVQVPEISFLCPEQSFQCSLEPHPATVDYSQSYLICSLKPSSVCHRLTKEQMMWLQNAPRTGSVQAHSVSCIADIVTTSSLSNDDIDDFIDLLLDKMKTNTENVIGRESVKSLKEPDSNQSQCKDGERPSLLELLRLEVPQQVSPNYSIFGIFLLNDETRSRIDHIEEHCHGNPEKITRKILQEWLEGKGLPVTWKSLVKTLRDSKILILANEIEAMKL